MSTATTAQRERAARAVREFERLRPTLQGFVRALTGRPLRLEAGPTSGTDGRTVFLRPPILLADRAEHVRGLCPLRDELLQPRCPACARSEAVYTTLFHEISHLVAGSMDTLPRRELAAAAIRGARHGSAAYRTFVEQAAGDGYGMLDIYRFLTGIHPHFLGWTRAMDDARIDAESFRARPGVEEMRFSQTYALLRRGIDVNGTFEHWRDRPVEQQFPVAALAITQGHDAGAFSPEVGQTLALAEFDTLRGRIPRTNIETVELAVGWLGALNRLGLYELPLPEDEPPQAPDLGGAGGSTEDGDDADENEGQGNGSDGDRPAGESPESGDGGGAGGSGDADAAGEPESADGGSDSESSADPGADGGGGGDAAEADDAGPGVDGESADDGDAGLGDDDLGAADPSGARGDAESAEGSGGVGGAAAQEGEVDAQQDREESGAVADGAASEGGDPGAAGVEPEDGPETADPGVDVSEDQGGDRGGQDERDLLERHFSGVEHSSPDEIAEAVDHGSGHARGEEVMHDGTPVDDEALEAVIAQALSFDAFSGSVSGLTVEPPGEGPAYPARGRRPWRHIPVPEAALAPSVMRARRVFSDSKLDRHQRNLRRGKLNQGALARRAPFDDDRVFKRTLRAEGIDFEVVLGLDVSWSTSDGAIRMIKQAAEGLATVLHRVGVPFAVYAHTTDNPYARSVYRQVMHTVKAVDHPWGPEQKGHLTELSPVAGSLDGHNLEFYRKLLDRSRARKRLLVYFTDGEIPETNRVEELEIIQRETRIYAKRGYSILGVGIRNDSPKKFGLDTVRIDSGDDIVTVIREIEKRITTT